jgi:hypothetical protein
MSDSDILAIQLWFGGAAIAFLAIAVSAAGWNHRYFVRTMFAIAILLVIPSIFWKFISTILTVGSAKTIVAMANSPVSWLVMFC